MDDIGEKSLMENDGGKPDGGVRLLEEAGILVEKSDVGAVNSGIKRNDSGYIGDKHDGSKNRVVELMSGDDGWGMRELVGRVLNGDLGKEVEKGNVSEDQPEISLVVDLGTTGESTIANGEGNGLYQNPDSVTNEKVPDANFETEGLDIVKVNVYNNEHTDVEDPREGATLNGTRDFVTNELVPGGKLETEGVDTAEADVGTDKRTDIEDSSDVTTMNRKQDFLAGDIVQAENLGMEVIKNGKADVVITERNGVYCISDLVWGKVKSHPWWPGQIFAPSAASDKALRYSKKDGYLIAYFGDQTFAWNDVSKMKPFQVNFTEMEKQSSAEAFSYAVNCALDEVSRRVEVGLSCPCVPVDVFDQIKTQVIANAGIRQESSRREGQDNSFTAASFLPIETLQLVESLAVMPNFETDRLQFAILKAGLLAFNRWRGVYQLSMFEVCGFLVDDDTRCTTEFEGIDPKEVNGGVTAFTDIASEVPSRKRKHAAQEQTAKRMGRKKVLSAKKQESIISGSKEKRKHSQLSPMAIDGMDIQPEKKPRVRKPIQQTSQSDSKESKMLEMIQLWTLTPDETVEKLNSAAKTPLQEHDDTMMQAVNFLREYMNFNCQENSSACGQIEHEGENKGEAAADIFGFEGIEDSYLTDRVIQLMTLTPDETLEKLHLAAKKPMEKHDDTMTHAVNFLRKYWNSICLEKSGACSQTEHGGKNKGKQPGDIFEVTEDSYWTDRVIKGYSQPRDLFEPDNPTKLESNKQDNETVIVVSDTESPMEEYRPTCLILNFTSLESIPPIPRLNEIFRPYGPLNESDTMILSKSKRAKVTFKKRADAETAFSSTGKYSIFGPSLVSYRLHFVPTLQAKPTLK